MTNHPLTEQEFWDIYKKVPRLTVELIIRNSKNEVYLTKRDIEPCKGLWHLPGGTVRFGEPLTKAVKRIAKRELGITPTDTRLLGYIEYPSHYLNGLDSPVGIAFAVTTYEGRPRVNEEAAASGWFIELPKEMHDEQQDFLKGGSVNFSCVKIITTAPLNEADKIREALGKAGAGKLGEYSFCSFSYRGTGRFMPSEDANPHIGEANKLEIVEEEQIEVICDRANAKQVVAALRKAHPYEEPVVDIVPLLSEDEL